MIPPKINKDGTHLKALRGQYDRAFTALRAAVKALELCDVNPRDYSNIGEYERALEEHVLMIQMVQAARDGIGKISAIVDVGGDDPQAILEALLQQVRARKGRSIR